MSGLETRAMRRARNHLRTRRRHRSEPDFGLRTVAGAARLAIAQTGQAADTRSGVGRIVPLRRRDVKTELRTAEERRAGRQRRREGELRELLRRRAVGLLLHVAGFGHQLEVLRDRIRAAAADRELLELGGVVD